MNDIFTISKKFQRHFAKDKTIFLIVETYDIEYIHISIYTIQRRGLRYHKNNALNVRHSLVKTNDDMAVRNFLR